MPMIVRSTSATACGTTHGSSAAKMRDSATLSCFFAAWVHDSRATSSEAGVAVLWRGWQLNLDKGSSAAAAAAVAAAAAARAAAMALPLAASARADEAEGYKGDSAAAADGDAAADDDAKLGDF